MSAPASKPVRSTAEGRKRAQRIFARLMGGRVDPRHRRRGNLERPPGAADRPRAARSPRRQSRRRLCAPPDRAARAGARPHRRPDRRRQAVGGARLRSHPRPSEPPRARPPAAARRAFQRIGDEVDKMEERLGRLDAAREALALQAGRGGPQSCARTQRNETGLKPLITKETAKRLIRRPQ